MIILEENKTAIMSDPKNHHYIPQSYLRNFASERKKGHHEVFVKAKDKEIFNTNIENICSEKYLYTITGVPDDKKNLIENYYAVEIDSAFPTIVDIVTDDKVEEIDAETRKKFISSVLSLYFRTPKFLNRHNEFMLRLIRQIKDYHLGNSEIRTADFFGRKLDLAKLNFEELEDLIIRQNKLIFLKEHFRMFNSYVDYKIEDGIGINKIINEYELITSDNPVSITNIYGKPFNLFDDDNMISVPINNKYVLEILPHSLTDMKNTFHRIEGDLIPLLSSNHKIEENSERWLIGSKDGIENNFILQKKYGEETPDNLEMLEKLKQSVILSKEFQELLVQLNTNPTDEIASKLKQLSENPILKDDSNIKRSIKELREQGHKV